MKFTPAKMMFGQELRLPLDYDVPGPTSAETVDIAVDDGDDDGLARRMQQFVELSKARDEALGNSHAAQQQQKQRYNRTHAVAGPPLKVGEEVLVKNSRRQQRKGDKQQSLYNGPYEIEEITNGGSLRLKGRKNVVAVSNVKRYCRAEVNEANQEHESKAEEETTENKENSDQDEEIEVFEVDEGLDCGLCLEDSRPKPTKKRTQMLSTRSDDLTIQFAPVDQNWQKSRAGPLNLRISKTVFTLTVSKTVSRFAKSLQMRTVKGMGNTTLNFGTLLLILGDGNCFFRAVCFYLCGSDRLHKALRNQLANYMAQNKKEIQRIFKDEEDYDAHVDSLKHDGQWTNECDIWAMATMLNTTIMVYTKHGQYWSWAEFKPIPTVKTLLPSSGCKIYINHTNLNHYDPVLDI